MALNQLTKVELIEKVREAQTREARERADAAAWQSELETVRAELALSAEKVRASLASARVPEADALAGCIRALDAIPAIRNDERWAGRAERPDARAIRRVLVALADRFEVPLVEQTTEPCSRLHLDEVDPMAVTAALHQGVTR